MRATYVPDPAATVGVARLTVIALAAADVGELTLYFKDGRQVRDVLPGAQLRDVLRQWAAAARDGKGELEIGE